MRVQKVADRGSRAKQGIKAWPAAFECLRPHFDRRRGHDCTFSSQHTVEKLSAM